MTPDVNVLVAAFLSAHPQHERAREWLKGALRDCLAGNALQILPMVAVGFLRVVTSFRTSPATSINDAVAFLGQILSVPGVWMPELGREWSILQTLCAERNLQGGIITDAWIAAAVRAHDLHLVTFDADFRKLLRPHQFTLLLPQSNLQEPRPRYSTNHGRGAPASWWVTRSATRGRAARRRADAVRAKLDELGVKEADIENAIRWARR